MIGRSSREQGPPSGVVLASKTAKAKMLPQLDDIVASN